MGKTIIKNVVCFKKHSRMINILTIIVFATLVIGCSNSNIENIKLANEYYGSMEKYTGVSMRTEGDVYAPGTMRMLVYWENNTNEEFMFGDS